MTWVVVLMALSAEPDGHEPQATVWVQPLGLILAPMPVDSGLQAFYFSAGATALLPSGLELAAEVGAYEAKFVAAGPDQDTSLKRAFLLAVGPVLHTGDRAFSGFFIQPKLMFEIGGGHFDSPPFTRFDFGVTYTVQVGATAGWQLRWKRLYLALSLGASAGIGNQPPLPVGPIAFGFVRQQRVGFQWALDVNLLRIGIAL